MTACEEVSLRLPDGYRAYARFWTPTRLCGAVLYHHGIQSHCGWYEESARRLAEAGFGVLQVDRRGSGQNLLDRGHAQSALQLLQDSAAARDHLLSRTGLAHYHLVGVSWGGKLVVAAHVHDPTGVASLTLVTPGLFPQVGVSRGEMARIGMAMLYEPRRLFPIPLNDPELFTKTPAFQEFFRGDEPTLRQCTAGFYLASRRMDRIVAQLPKAPRVPLHLFLAGEERIIDNDKTIRFISDLNWPEIRITLYPGARHSLEFEEQREDYFQQVVDFIAAAEETRHARSKTPLPGPLE